MGENLVAKASVTIGATRADVWKALLDPAAIERYMFGAKVVSDWREGRPITWSGEWRGKPYQDKGTILQARGPASRSPRTGTRRSRPARTPRRTGRRC